METKILLDENIELRAASPEWAAEKYAAAIASREHLLPWLDWIHFYENGTPEEGAEKMREFQSGKVAEFEKGTNYTYDIFVDGKFAGGIELMAISNENHYCEIGYWLVKDFTGRGIMTRAVNLLTDLAFEKLGMHCVSIYAAHENMASRAVAERCGFKFEAELRDRLLLEGKYYNRTVYSKLDSEN
ncbi:GNAT family N-acetyltransferase [Candidatus Saccharibacteria bacterium]|nr:GNAT family N-acetyltransferase [Candidatus Saccharibacteria bacterium]